MKKIISFLALFSIVAMVFAQDRSVERTLKTGDSYYEYTGTSADTLNANQDTIDVYFNISKGFAPKFYMYVDIDTTSTTSLDSLRIIPIRRLFDDDSWSTDTEVDYFGTADTTFTVSEATATYIRTAGLRFIYVGSGGELELQKLYIKTFEQ